MKPKKHDRLMEQELAPPPNPPLVSSDGMGWEKLQFYYYHQPASAIQEHVQTHYVICINLGNPVVVEKNIDGKQHILDELKGDMSIYPANTRQSFQWNKNAEFCQILLQPSVLFDALDEIFPTQNIEFHPDIKTKSDPIITHLGLSLKNAVETNGASSKLYADSIAHALAIHLAT